MYDSPDGFFVSNDGLDCVKCPTVGVTCRSGVISVDEGWWSPALAQANAVSGNSSLVTTTSASARSLARYVSSNTTFYACPIEGACRAGADGAIECTNHRAGPLCALCEDSYVLVNEDCVQCGSASVNWAMLITAMLVLVIGITIVVRNAMMMAHKGWVH